jgi:hypothetical protein
MMQNPKAFSEPLKSLIPTSEMNRPRATVIPGDGIDHSFAVDIVCLSYSRDKEFVTA